MKIHKYKKKKNNNNKNVMIICDYHILFTFKMCLNLVFNNFQFFQNIFIIYYMELLKVITDRLIRIVV